MPRPGCTDQSAGSMSGSRRRPAVTMADVQAAAGRLAGVAHHTPVLTSATLDDATGATALLKAECLQRTGSFKFRGAYNAVATLVESERRRGVLAFSSGNHAQAVALACRLLDVPATILMPQDAPATKLAATRSFGADIVTYDRYGQDRDSLARKLATERGLTLVPPFDDPQVIAGQGTAVLELLGDAGALDLLVVPVGGGGLIAGTAVAATALHPGIRIIGVEPLARTAGRRSLAAGRRVRADVPRTIADGQQTPALGRLTFPVIRDHVEAIVAVDDDRLVDAMTFLFDRCRLVTEPSGACGVAALLAGTVEAGGQRVGVVVSGGNVGHLRFAELVMAVRQRGRGAAQG